MPDRRPAPRLTRGERLLFEAGIKLGGIFHQFLGVPVAPATAPGLARAIEAAVRLQPYVLRVRVTIDPAAGGRAGRGRYGYRYLSAPMLRATVTVADAGARVTARLAFAPALRYPLMRPVELVRGGARRPAAVRPRARRSVRS
jgi:dihydroneopterin aldolase